MPNLPAVAQPAQGITRRAAVLLCLLLAFLLRMERLDGQSFWYDEGNSARIAERSPQLIIEGAAGDIHPPLYYLALKAWRAGAGESELALRAMSVWAGLLSVALVAGLARRAGAHPAVAAFLAAVSPFAVYYAQEARMYALLALWASASSYALLRLTAVWCTNRPAGMTKPFAVWGALYATATLAGMYTQYAYPFVMLAQGVWFVAWLASQPRSRLAALAGYAGLNVFALAAFAPWVPIAWRQISTWPSADASGPASAAILDVARWLVVGRTLPLEASWPALAFAGALMLLGARSQQRANAALLAIWLLAPIGLFFALHLVRDAYLKVLLMCGPALAVLAARGIALLARRASGRGAAASAALCGLALLTVAPSLVNLYANPAYARDDYRGIARLINTNWRPTDAVLFSAPNQWEVFTYYRRDATGLFPLAYRPESEAAAAQSLDGALTGHERIYVLYFGDHEGDPGGLYEWALAERSYKGGEQWVGNIRLATYAARWQAAPPAPSRCTDPAVAAGAGIRLLQAAYAATVVHPGDVVPVQLALCAPDGSAPRLKTFLHLALADGPPVAQNDAEPVGGLKPTSGWKAGEVVVDRRAVSIPPHTTAGDYVLYVGWYDPDTGVRIPLGAAAPDGRLRLGALRVEP